ncbi:MAG: regulatory signaling modulator protein AmpE [Pseudomonadota bacterium]|nr:regulatory signaling modulator protein AmpE [Pseudomonadota bacterium]
MKLLILLIALGVQRYLNVNFSLASFDWFTPYQKMVKKLVPAKLMQGYVGVLILVLPIAVIVALVGAILNATWLTGLIFGSVVMFYCLDGRDLGNQLGIADGQEKIADARAREVLEESIPRDPAAKARAVSSGIFAYSLYHVFSVMFWYLIFGVFGAVTYVLIQHIASASKKEGSDLAKLSDNASTLQAGFDWLPVRLFGASLAAVGSSANVIKQLSKNLVGGFTDQGELATVFGLAAIKANPEKAENATVKEDKDALNLVFMSTGVWLAVVLVFTVIALV